MSPACTSSTASAPVISSRTTASPSRSLNVPCGSPGKHRLRFLPSSGVTNGVRDRNEVTLSTGTAVTVPRSPPPAARSRVHSRTAAIGAYSQPRVPASTVSRGPSWSPVSSMTGTVVPARSSVRYFTVVGIGGAPFVNGHAGRGAVWSGGEQALGRGRRPEQGPVPAPAAGQLQADGQLRAGGKVPAGGRLRAGPQTRCRDRQRDRGVAGKVVRAGEAALPVVGVGAERRILLRRRVADGGPGQRGHPGQAGVDGGGQFGLLGPGPVVLPVADGGAEVQQGPGSGGGAGLGPAPVGARRLPGHDRGQRVLPPPQLVQPGCRQLADLPAARSQPVHRGQDRCADLAGHRGVGQLLGEQT